MTATSATIRLAADGTARVDSYLRLTGGTWIQCCTYEDHPPILSLHDAQAEVSIGVPCPERVTQDDAESARRLAAAVARYAAEVEKFAADHGALDDPDRPGGQAA
jgi:hypothetical protein